MPLQPGTSLGPYQIDAPLGAGGMGEVYQATDTRLDRIVVIKVLPEHVAADPDLKQRFEREAKTISSLNHPHICTLYDIGQEGDTDFLVMEYLEGETLAQRLTTGPLPTAEVLRYATEIADALDKAHRQGIVHPDLKPGNIMLTATGTKLLDFGLAKLKPATEGAAGLTALPTQSAGLTMQGTILGTLQYMAPESLDGKEADARTDLFAFGAILYEMVTGKKAFAGEGRASLIAAIMHVDPPAMSTLQSMTPPALDHVVKTCLAKSPDDRWQTAGDVGRHLKWITEGGSHPSVASSVTVASQPAGWRHAVTIAAVAALVGGIAVWSLMRSAPSVPRVERFVIPPPAPETVNLSNNRPDIAISPDGTRVVYLATGETRQLYVRSVDSLTATPLQVPGILNTPFVSPNSAWVGFNDQSDGTMKRVSITGGPAVTICSVPRLRGASWGPDNTIIFGNDLSGGLSRVSANGGEPEELTRPDVELGVRHGWPDVLPGGRAVLFTIFTRDAPESAQIALLDLDSGEQRVLVAGGSAPRYSPTGHIVYAVSGTLRAVGFDVDRLEVTNPNPVPVLDGVITKSSGAANFDIARDGSLVYVAGAAGGGTAPRTLVWVDREGREEAVADLPANQYNSVQVFPDGTRLAVAIGDGEGGSDVWAYDIARGTRNPITTDGLASNPLWTPDGRQVVFTSQQDGIFGLYRRNADGTGDAETLLIDDDARGLGARAWTPEGDAVVFERFSLSGNQSDLALLSLEDERAVELLLDSEFNESRAALSPNGQWIAYDSNRSGRPEVYVERFPDLGERQPVSTNGGRLPRWSPNGRELFYQTQTGDRVYGSSRHHGGRFQRRESRHLGRRTVFSVPE